MAEKLEKLLVEHPIISGIVLLGVVIGIFSALDFRGNNLMVITFVTMVVEVVIYFDARLKIVEKKVDDSKKLSWNVLRGKKGLTQFAWFVIVVLIIILIWYLVTNR